MCGIAGIVNLNKNSRPVSPREIESMLRNLHHRGPDDSGVFLSENRQIGLGVVRLSFVDLKNGHQPLIDTDKKAVIAYNGEVYGFQQHKIELKKNGFKFRTRTDTEYVLNNYLHQGTTCLQELNGEFAFAIHDIKENITIIARDHFGVRPLYFTIQKNKLIFSSEIKGIFALSFIKRSLNTRTVVEQLMRADSLARTVFENINILRPGHFIRVKNNAISFHQYWDFNLPTIQEDRNESKSIEEYCYKLEDALSKAIKNRIHADVELGCFLSGGLDSSIISALMQKHSSKPIQTFSLQFKDKCYDESHYSHMVAKHIGSKHHTITLSATDLANEFPKALFHCEHLVQQIDGTGKYLLAKEAAKHVKGVLVGEGADELFLGYPWFKVIKTIDEKCTRKSESLMRTIEQRETARKGLDLTIHKHRNIEKYRQRFGFYPVSIGNILEMEKFAYNLFNKEIVHTLKKYDPSNVYLEDLNRKQLENRSLLRQNQYEFTKKTLPYYVLQFLGGKVEMAHSLEGRLPFFDKHVVKLATQIPERFLLNGLTEKYILKKTFRHLLPQAILERTKHGYSSPILSGFLDKKAPSYFHEMLSKKTTLDVGLFCPKEVQLLLQKCLNEKGSLSQRATLNERAIIFILSVHLIHHMFIKNGQV